MELLKLAAGSRTVAKPRMQTRPKRKKPVSFVLLLVLAAMLLFALAPASTTTVISDSQLAIGNVTTVCPDEIQAGNITIDAEPIQSDLNNVTAYSRDGLTGTEIKQKMQEFVAAPEEQVNADDIVSFAKSDVMGAGESAFSPRPEQAAFNGICDIYVNQSGWWPDGGTFSQSNTPIQHAIGSATASETICVYNGSYTENVDVGKQLTLRGEGADVVYVTAKYTTNQVFEVTADYVNISGFNVIGATGENMAGFYIHSGQHCNISNNNASGNYYGIYLRSSSYNMLTSNIITSNSQRGIYVHTSTYNTIYNNYFNNTATNAIDTNENNVWNITPKLGTNIIGGSWLGGNYWSDYAGNDTTGDDLGDTLTPYKIGITNGGDCHPLVTPDFAAPNITDFAPESPVNDTYCTWRKFNVTVNQTVNVTWYLNGTAQTPKNESVTDAEYTLHAEYTGVNNVTAVAENANGMAKREWLWNVTEATLAIEVNKTVWDPSTGNWEKVILANVSDELQFRILVHNNGTGDLTNITVNDTLSAGLEYVNGSAKVNGGACEPPGLGVWANSLVWYYDVGNSCTDPFKNLSCEQNITLEFNATKNQTGDDTNCVNVSGWFNGTEPNVQVLDDDYAVVRGQQDDAVIFRDGTWYIDTDRNQSTDIKFSWGRAGDIPLFGDYNRDGYEDVVIFRSGTWYIDTDRNQSTDIKFSWGRAGDIPLFGDYNRDGYEDVVIFRSGTWYIDTDRNQSTDIKFSWGRAGDIPLFGDYNRDGYDDVVIFRSGTWYIDTDRNQSTDIKFSWGRAGDIPLFGDYNRDGYDDVVIFRSGTWYIDTDRNQSTDIKFSWGRAGDIPLFGVYQ